MQTQGSLAEANLASLLQTMQSERATGTLSLENGESTCALYFLFGHLFHGAGPAGQGESVVVDALTWTAGTFKFDPRAKLPAEETIKASPSDLIAEAEQRGGAPISAIRAAAYGADTGSGGAAGSATATAESPPADQAPGEATEPVPATTRADDTATDTMQPPRATYGRWDQPAGTVPDAAPTYSAASPTWSNPPAGVPVGMKAAADPGPDEGDGSNTWSAGYAATVAEDDTWSPAPQESYAEEAVASNVASDVIDTPAGVADGTGADSTHRAGPADLGGHVPAEASGNCGRRASDAAPVANVYPLPSGKPIYEGLKSAFVDFPKLLSTLRKDSHTGYVRLSCDDFTGVLLLDEGQVLEALAEEVGQEQGEPAFKDIQARMDSGEGALDVIELAGDTVAALAQLLVARPLFTGLLGRFVNFTNLIDYLEEEKIDGSVIVATDDDCGVILLRTGEVLGAYTQSDSTLESKTTGIEALAAERSARIEVKGGTAEIDGIDVDRLLGR